MLAFTETQVTLSGGGCPTSDPGSDYTYQICDSKQGCKVMSLCGDQNVSLNVAGDMNWTIENLDSE